MTLPSPPKVHLIIIGDEILSGHIQDLNVQPLASWLEERGLPCEQVTISKDREDLLFEAFKRAWKSADLIITTGGLGPTEDDITKRVLAKLSQSPLVEKESALRLVKELYARHQRKWNPKLNNYHLIPEKAEVFDNPKGFAPGLSYKAENKLLLCTPGVPRELQAMKEGILPQLIQEHFPQLPFHQKKMISLRTYGVAEEKIFGELCPGLWKWLEQFGKVSSLPQRAGVDIHIKPESPSSSPEAFEQLRRKISHHLQKTPLKDYIWSDDFLPLEEVVIRMALKKGVTLAMAESCTGGLVSHRLTNISGSSAVFKGSFVTYSNEAKISALGVKEETLKKWGAVSQETAKEMAQGALEELGSDLALSLTGIAGPTGGTPEKPVGMVCIGLASREALKAYTLYFQGERSLLKERFAQAALFKAFRFLKAY